MDYNQLRVEWEKEGAALRLVEDIYHRSEGYIETQMKADLKGLSPAERAEYIEIVASAKGLIPLKDRKEIIKSVKWSRAKFTDGFLTDEEIKLFIDTFTKSQENQFLNGRDTVAKKLKALNRSGMSLHNRKRYLMEAANDQFLMRDKGESMLKKALEKQAAEKEAEKQARKALRAKSKKGKGLE